MPTVGTKVATPITTTVGTKVATPITTTVGTKVATPLNEGQQTATYIDDKGNRKTGLYRAAAENAGIGAQGSGESGQASPAGSSGSHWDQMRGMYQQMYDEQVAANNAANEAAAQRAREANQAQIDALRAGYQGTNRQLYRDYMEHQRVLPQQMAARGYSGGLSESAQLRLRNSYEEGLNENERARLGQENSAAAALAQQLYDAQAKTDAANQQANQQRLGYIAALEEQQHQQDQAERQQRAATLASAGDFSGYRDLGYSDEEIQYLSDIWARQNPALAYSLGKIGADVYYQLTGAYPPGYEAPSSGGGWYGGAPPAKTTTEHWTDTTPLNDDTRAAIIQSENTPRNNTPSFTDMVRGNMNFYGRLFGR